MLGRPAGTVRRPGLIRPTNNDTAAWACHGNTPGGVPMKNSALKWFLVGSAVLISATAAGGPVEERQAYPQSAFLQPAVQYVGLINDYTPSAAVTKGGPYEMRGKWSLEVDERHGT